MRRSLVIFGSTGNLTYKKLIPALYRLLKDKHIDATYKIYMVGRRPWTTEDYLGDAEVKVTQDIDWDVMSPLIEYVELDVHEEDDYKTLAGRIESDGYQDVSVYLAVPPKLFPVIAEGISASALIGKGDRNKRIVFEKPFGEDLKSARDINESLWECFTEEQIFRIDHYLGKEMIQNVLTVRFANRIFEQTWNSEGIESITILAKESDGVMNRGGYYDKIGAIKDMLQSHLLQMASLIAMERPNSSKSEDIKKEKVRILKALSFDDEQLILGQYEGYQDADKVEGDSQTETFVHARAFVDTERWKGVPFHFLTGKKLDEKRSEIIIRFRDDSGLHVLYPDAHPGRDRLVIKVAPEEGVELRINVKEPGLKANVRPVTLDYCHSCEAMGNTPEAYEKLLLELIEDNHTLFTGWDEIETTWKRVEAIKKGDGPPRVYTGYDDILGILKENGVDTDDL